MFPAQGRKGAATAGLSGYEKVSLEHSRGLSDCSDLRDRHECGSSKKTVSLIEEVAARRQLGALKELAEPDKQQQNNTVRNAQTHENSAHTVTSSVSGGVMCSNGLETECARALTLDVLRPQSHATPLKRWNSAEKTWQSVSLAEKSCSKVSFGSEAISEVHSSSLARCHVVEPHELGRVAPPADGSARRDSTTHLVEEPAATTPGRDRGHGSIATTEGSKSSASHGNQDQCRKPQEARDPTFGTRDGSANDRKRDHRSPQGEDAGPGHAADGRTCSGSCGIWEVVRENLHRDPQREPRLLQMGEGYRQGRRRLSSPTTLGRMAGKDGGGKEALHAEGSIQEGWEDYQDGGRCSDGRREFRQCQFLHSRNGSDGGAIAEHSEGLGGRSREGEDREQGIEEEDPLRRGRDYFDQRVGGSAKTVMLPEAAQVVYGADSESSSELESLSASEARSLEWRSNRILPECMEALVQARRPVLYEVACGPQSRLSEKMQQLTGSQDSCRRFAFWNGYDVGTSVGVRGIIKEINQNRPQHVWLSLECGPFSKMQQINQRTDKQIEELKQKREACMRMYVGGLLIYMHCVQLGITVTWEWAETSDAWRLPMVQNVFAKYPPWMCIVKGCRVQLKDPKGKGLLGKGWKLATTHPGIAHQMDLPCMCPGKHVPCQGTLTRMSAYYTEDFAKRVCRALLHPTPSHMLFDELRFGKTTLGFSKGHMKECNCAAVRHPKSPLKCNLCEMGHEHDEKLSLVGMEVEDVPLSDEEQTTLLKKIAQLHRNTGHGPIEHLVKALEDRQSDPRVVALAKTFICPVRQELKRQVPRPRVSLNPLPPKWQVLQGDNAHWVHPQTQERIQFTILIDEGCRFRIGKIMCKGPGGVKAEQFIQFYQENWKPVFGKPAKIRLDPAGPWRAQSVDDYFSQEQVEMDIIPAEAHWGISHVERAIQCTKHIMNKLALSEPEITPEEALSEALRCENEREVVRGFSPAQHALGRSPDEHGRFLDPGLHDVPKVLCENANGDFQRNVERMKQAETALLEHVAHDRLQRAQSTRSYRVEDFVPGDLVFVWRVQSKGSASSSRTGGFRTGGFTGPCRVLATETRVSEEGQLRPGSTVWLIRGSRLLKANSRQLRRASVQEECLEELSNPVTLPWTFTKLSESLGERQYEDISEEMPEPLEYEQGLDEEQMPIQRRVRQKRAAPEFPRPSMDASNTEERDPFGHLVVEQEREEFCDHYAECYWQTPGAAVEIEVEIPQSIRGKKYMTEHFTSFLTAQLRRRGVEVTERHLSSEDLLKFKEAKNVEVKKFVGADALQALPPHLQPSRADAMRMRWVLTWKKSEDGNQTAKARCVVLGYQDPHYEHRQTMAPTMSRTTRQIMLSIAAALGMQVAKGDVSGAFLQGRAYQHEAYVIPTDEICEAMNIPSGSVTKLKKCCYGLVDAPLEWFLTVSDFLVSIGFSRCVGDPCCFRFVSSDNQLIGLVSGHVDDFVFCGRKNCEIWKGLCRQIQEKFHWGTWEYDSFIQCGVKIEHKEDGGFELSQAQYIEDMREINISAERRREPKAWTSDSEKTKIRAALGALSWCAQQTQPQLSAAVGLLLSQVTTSTVSTMIEINKLIHATKCNKKHVLKIHGDLKVADLLVACWTDASAQNRQDGKSTMGLLVGLTSQKLLNGEMCNVSPVYWRSAKITRQCRSPGAAEALAAIDGEDAMYAVRLQVYEMLGNEVNVRKTEEHVAKIPGVLVTDSTNVHDRLHSEVYVPKGPEHRTALELLGLKESVVRTQTPIRWVHSDAQLANSLTKDNEPQQLQKFYQLNQRWRIVDDPLMRSTRNRKKIGLQTLENGQNTEIEGLNHSCEFPGDVDSIRTQMPS